MKNITLSLYNEDGSLKSKEELQNETEILFRAALAQAEDQQAMLVIAQRMGIPQAIAFLVSQQPKPEVTAEDRDDEAFARSICPSTGLAEDEAIEYIKANPNVLSSDIRAHFGYTKNRWAYILQRLGERPEIRKQGSRVSMRFFYAAAA